MDESNNLLACPFCGKDTGKVKNVGVELGDPEYAVRCETCWFDGPTDWDKEKAVAQWNARAGAPEPTNNGRSAVALHALVRPLAASGIADCPKCGALKSVARHNADWTCHKCGFNEVVDADREAV